MKPKCSKIALISTLINTGCGLSVVSLWTRLSVSQTSEAIWLYTLRYHSIGFGRFVLAVIFSACCVYLNILCIIRCLHSKSAIISRDHGHPYKIPDLWPPNSSDLNPIQLPLATKFGSQFSNESRVQKCRTWRIWCGIWLMHRMEWKRALFRMSLTIGTGICIQPQRILWIFSVTKISMIVKIELNLMLNQTFLSD